MGLAIGFTGFTDTCVAPVPTCLAACSLASPIHHALAPASWADSPAHPAFASATTLLPLYSCLLTPASDLASRLQPRLTLPSATLAWCYHSVLPHIADRRTASPAFVPPDLSNGRGAPSSPPPCLPPQPRYHATTTSTSASDTAGGAHLPLVPGISIGLEPHEPLHELSNLLPRGPRQPACAFEGRPSGHR
jgi:hypothetical protein